MCSGSWNRVGLGTGPACLCVRTGEAQTQEGRFPVSRGWGPAELRIVRMASYNVWLLTSECFIKNRYKNSRLETRMNHTSFSKTLPSEAPSPLQVTVPVTHGRFGLGWEVFCTYGLLEAAHGPLRMMFFLGSISPATRSLVTPGGWGLGEGVGSQEGGGGAGGHFLLLSVWVPGV